MERSDAQDVAPRAAARGEPWRRFALVFAALAIASELAYYGLILGSAGFQAYLGVLARISGTLLAWVEPGVVVDGTRIGSARFAVEVADGCDAIQICFLLSAAVMAFPLPLARRARGLVAGVLWLQTLNFARIASLFWIGAYASQHFTTFHKVIWPTFLVAVTVATWIAWVLFEFRRGSTATAA